MAVFRTSLGESPKDFDIATNATPEDIRKLFNNARIIGKRFKIVHIRFGHFKIIEVTTFRGSSNTSSQQIESSTGQLLRDNVYGTLESDAIRRDFTVNALYYSVKDFSIHDFCSGINDIQQRYFFPRIIGDPTTRYQERPCPLIACSATSCKLGFTIEPKTEQQPSHKHPCSTYTPARLFDEVLKLFMHGHATASYQQLLHYGVVGAIVPETADFIQGEPAQAHFIEVAMTSTDKRIRTNKRVAPAFLYASLLMAGIAKKL